jgi:peptide-methionine (R)-S-oxide reductase
LDIPSSIFKTNDMSIKHLLLLLSFCSYLVGCQSPTAAQKETGKTFLKSDTSKTSNPFYSTTDTNQLHLPDSVWKKILSPAVYQIARNKGTERAFSGKYWDFEGLGTYYCAVCGNALFRSDAKFSSSCGWPSFYESIRERSVLYKEDHTHGMHRTEVLCGRCGGHLGHIFDDGPPPTGKRFCMNSLMLDFVPQK